jgi:polyphenol oxidase
VVRPAVIWTDRSHGDLADPAALAALAGLPGPCTWLHQVHGPDVVVVGAPGEAAGAEADAAVTAVPGCPIAVRTADCAPLVLWGPGTLGVVHAGWRGLLGGVVGAAADVMTRRGGAPVGAQLGPCIRAGCYEFGGHDLDAVAERFGSSVRATTGWGTPALDLAAAVRAACTEVGVDDVDDAGSCTACEPRWYSHRARADVARQATVAWLPTAGAPV